jgi:hypothetical protein
MNVPTLGVEGDNPTVVVLGAGASRGASFVSDAQVLPPLDADFFDQAQRMSPGLNSADKSLIEFIHNEFGLSGFPTLETFFTQIEAVDRFHHDFNIKGRVSQKFRRQLTTLRRLIPKVFLEAFKGRECTYHRRLAGALRASDVVLSFNYDCLMDEALRREGGKRWRAETGYGFGASQGFDLWDSPPEVGPPYKNPIRLLKPHGSLNWALSEDRKEVSLVAAYDAEAQRSIVPPTWDKSEVAEWPWNEVWRASRRALAQARLLIVIGYSVPLTDQLSQALLRADVHNLRGLIIVNPDPAARDRMKSLLSSALNRSSVIVELATFDEFARHLPLAPTEEPPLDVVDSLRQLEMRLARAASSLHDMEDQAQQQEFIVDEIREEIDSVRADLPDFKDEIARLEGLIWDVESRVDSIPL